MIATLDGHRLRLSSPSGRLQVLMPADASVNRRPAALNRADAVRLSLREVRAWSALAVALLPAWMDRDGHRAAEVAQTQEITV